MFQRRDFEDIVLNNLSVHDLIAYHSKVILYSLMKPNGLAHEYHT
jgi:hypothetical protein